MLLSTLGGFMMLGMDGFVTGPTLALLFVTVRQIFMEESGRGECETIVSGEEKPALAFLCPDGDELPPSPGGAGGNRGEKTETSSSGSVSSAAQSCSGKEEG